MKNLGFNSTILRSLSKGVACMFLLSASNSAFAALLDSKVFNPSTIVAGQNSVLEITIQNMGDGAATALNVRDTLPAGVTIANSAFTTNGNCGTLVGPLVVGSQQITLTGGAVANNTTCIISITVTSATGGVVTNTIPAGATTPAPGVGIFYTVGAAAPTTVFGNGATATLTVNARPTVSKQFSPDNVDDCGCSTLTITLTNPAVTAATLTAPFVDRFPSDLKTVGSASTTCAGGSVSAGSSSVTLQAGAIIPLNSFCTITVNVESKCNGEFTNVIAPGQLVTSNGSNALGTQASVNFCCEDHHASEVRQQCLLENTIDSYDSSPYIE